MTTIISGSSKAKRFSSGWLLGVGGAAVAWLMVAQKVLLWLLYSRMDFGMRFLFISLLLIIINRFERSSVLMKKQASLSKCSSLGLFCTLKLQWKVIGVHGVKFCTVQYIFWSCHAMNTRNTNWPPLLTTYIDKGWHFKINGIWPCISWKQPEFIHY